MSRPRFQPDASQQRLLTQLGREKQRIDQADVHLSALISQAKRRGIPIEHIARAAGITVKTVYNRLARLAEATGGAHPSQ